MITCISIDDQVDNVEIIADHAGKVPSLKLLKTFTDPLAGFRFLVENQVELVFLDI